MGLLDGVLPAVYSAGNKLKRQVGGLLSDPVGTVQQQIGLLNDKAGAFNQLHSQATQEAVNAARTGAGIGPAQQKIAGTLADAYNPMGMVVWHGSPHKFSKFDASKIGTGEGAQAYGHGLYLAESDEVAKGYQKTLASPRNRVMDRQGVYIEPSPMGDGKYRLATTGELGKMRGTVGDATQGITDYEYPNLASAMKAAKKQGLLSKDSRPVLNAVGEDGKYVPISKAADVEELLGYEPQYAQFIASDPGHLYKVDLPDDAIAKMLDWDKPLSQQAPEVKDAINRVGRSPESYGLERVADDMRMVEMQKLFQSRDGVEALRQHGIPGIRYLDGGSRGAGSGTSNFVIFPGNEGLLSILERNGQPIK